MTNYIKVFKIGGEGSKMIKFYFLTKYNSAGMINNCLIYIEIQHSSKKQKQNNYKQYNFQ